MALDPRYRHWADLHVQGRDQSQIAEVAGVNASTVSRALRRPEVVEYIERAQAKGNKPAAAAAPPTSIKDVDFDSLARGAAATAWSGIRQRMAAGEAVPTAELVRVADGLRKFAEEDSSGTSPAVIAAALADETTLSAVVAAVGPEESQRLWEALSGRIEAELGLDDDRVRWVFQHTETLLPAATAEVVCRLWGPVLELMVQHAAKLDALHRHREVCVQHGDSPDLASIDAVHPANPSALLEAARVELDRINTEETDNAA